MAEQTSFNDILADKPAETPVQVETKEAPVEIKEETKVERPLSKKQVHRDKEQLAQGRVRDPETGQYAQKVETVQETPKEAPKKEEVKPPAQEFTEKEKAFLKAAQEERGKRQELERRLALLEAEKTPKPEEKPFFDDPEGALKKQKDEISRQLAQLRSEIATSRLNTAEAMFRRNHPDFDEKVAVFGDLLSKTPGLHQKWMEALDPAEFAYETGKANLELKEAGGIKELRAKIEKETRLAIEAELKEKAATLAKERAALPPSLSDAPSKGANRTVWPGPTSMTDILKTH